MLRSLLSAAAVLAVFAPAGAYCQPPLREAQLRDDYTVREEMIPMRDGVRLFSIEDRIRLGEDVEREITQRILRGDPGNGLLYLVKAGEKDEDRAEGAAGQGHRRALRVRGGAGRRARARMEPARTPAFYRACPAGVGMSACDLGSKASWAFRSTGVVPDPAPF